MIHPPSQGVKLPGEKDGEYIETKLCLFADDTQLFNKNDESDKKSFDILLRYSPLFNFVTTQRDQEIFHY
jgi:hypothetical protein